MIIKKMSIKAFGKLKNLNIDLTNGLNIIYGKNESGKSTIISFIKGILYGLSKKALKDGMDEHEKYKPWSDNEYTGMIEYQVDDFKYMVGRNFATNKVSVYNEFWDDITDSFPKDKKKGVIFADEHLGLNEECFERTIFIRQLETKFNNSQNIMDKLLNIEQTGEEDTSLNDAISYLEHVIKEKIGNERTKKKPINIIEDKINQLEREKNEIISLREQMMGLQDEISMKETEKLNIIKEIEKAKLLKQIIKKQELIEDYNKAKEYETQLEVLKNEISRLKSFEDYSFEIQEEIKQYSIEIKNYEKMIEQKLQKLSEVEVKIEEINTGHLGDFNKNSENIFIATSKFEELKQLEASKEEIKQKVDNIDIKDDKDEEIFNKANILNKLSIIEQKLKSSSISLNIGKKIYLYDIDNISEDFHKLQEHKKEILNVEEKAAKRIIPFAFVVISFLFFALGWQLSRFSMLFYVAGIILIAVAIFFFIRFKSFEGSHYEKKLKNKILYLEDEIEKVLDAIGINYKKKHVTEEDILTFKRRAYEELELLENTSVKDHYYKLKEEKETLLGQLEQEELQGQLKEDITVNSLECEAEIKALNNQIADCKAVIKNILDLYEISYNESDFPTQLDIDCIKIACEQKNKIQGEYNTLLAFKQNLLSEIEYFKQEIDKNQRKKDEIFEKHLISSEEEYFEGCSKSMRLKELLTEYERVSSIYNEVLCGEDSEKILTKISSIKEVPSKDIPEESLDDAEKMFEILSKRLICIEEDILKLQNEINNMINGKTELNVIAEEMECLENEKKEMEKQRKSAELAIEVLKEVSSEMQKDFSPKFHKEISSIVSQITGGKYSQAKANNSLDLNVLTPEIGQIVGVETLSTATVDQFYLALRISLSNLLGKGKTKLPLIIDEAFANYDDERAKNTLEFLLKEAEHRQIIIFTCQNREMEIIKEIGKIKSVNYVKLS